MDTFIIAMNIMYLILDAFKMWEKITYAEIHIFEWHKLSFCYFWMCSRNRPKTILTKYSKHLLRKYTNIWKIKQLIALTEKSRCSMVARVITSKNDPIFKHAVLKLLEVLNATTMSWKFLIRLESKLLVRLTKLCNCDFNEKLWRVYDSTRWRFLNHLLTLCLHIFNCS